MKLLLALASIPASLTLAFLPQAGQDPKEDEPILTRDALGQVKRGSQGSLAQQVKGCWRLMDVAIPGRALPSGKARGFLIVEEHFLSLEIQASWGSDRTPIPDAYQTVVSEYEVDRAGLLTCTSLMGSYLDDTGQELVWEPPGQAREFLLEMPSRNMLVLRSLEGPAMTFARNLPSSPAHRSLTGEELPGPPPELDILGQPEALPPAEEKVETDIFGRPIETAPKESGDR